MKKDEAAPAKEEGGSWVPTILFLGVIAAGGAAFAKHKKMFWWNKKEIFLENFI